MAESFIWKESTASVDVRQENIEKQVLVEVNTRRIEKFLLQNSPVNNALPRNSLLNDMLQTDIDGQISIIPREVTSRAASKKTKQVVTLCSFSYADDVDMKIFDAKGSRKITAYDRRVYNAISTLYAVGRTTVSLNEIYSVMTGYERKNPTGNQIAAIEKCLKKLSSVNVYIDITNEVNAKLIEDKQPLIDAGILKDNSDNVKEARIEDHMLHYKLGVLTSEKGKTYKSIQILAEPTLLTYNLAKKTLITIPMEYIGLSNTNSTERSIAFQDYLLMRIMSYKHGKMRENKVLYETLYRDSGVEYHDEKPGSAKKEKQRDREIIRRMMSEWKEKGLISSYEEIKKGTAVVGISFETERDEKIEEKRKKK